MLCVFGWMKRNASKLTVAENRHSTYTKRIFKSPPRLPYGKFKWFEVNEGRGNEITETTHSVFPFLCVKSYTGCNTFSSFPGPPSHTKKSLNLAKYPFLWVFHKHKKLGKGKLCVREAIWVVSDSEIGKEFVHRLPRSESVN